MLWRKERWVVNKYYALQQTGNEASIKIYGDITSWEWFESDVSSYTLSKELDMLEANTIHVYINSYGGDVSEALAIYNSLKRHKAKIITYDDGFACSAASVVFMAGDERVMSVASLLMIHNAWTRASGNASKFRKQADDLDKITQASINAYMRKINIAEEKLKQLMDDESWITPQDALSMGFATKIAEENESNNISQSVRTLLFHQLTKNDQSFKLNPDEIANKVIEKIKNQIKEEERSPAKENKLQGFFSALTERNM